MPTVNFSFSTKKVSIPSSITPAHINVNLMQGGVVKASKPMVLPGASGSFTNVADGTGYTITAQRMSSANEPIGDLATSESFDVVTMQEVDVPDVVSVVI